MSSHTHTFQLSDGVLTCVICGLSREVPEADQAGVRSGSSVAALQATQSTPGRQCTELADIDAACGEEALNADT